jgi:hypothetical protein
LSHYELSTAKKIQNPHNHKPSASEIENAYGNVRAQSTRNGLDFFDKRTEAEFDV